MKLQPDAVVPGQLLPTPNSCEPFLFSLLTLPSIIQVESRCFEPPRMMAWRFVFGFVSPPLPAPPNR